MWKSFETGAWIIYVKLYVKHPIKHLFYSFVRLFFYTTLFSFSFSFYCYINHVY